MSLKDDLKNKVDEIVKYRWTQRKGRVVPDTDGLTFKSEAVHLERATVLYADLRGSTKMVEERIWWYAAEVYRSFLYCSGRIIREKGGTITSYDGDRIMAVFVGEDQTDNAARAAFKINYAVTKIINPRFAEQYPNHTPIKHSVGIDTSELRAVKTGVRDDHDIVWVGRAANLAAKLSELDAGKTSWVTSDAYNNMSYEVCFAAKDAAPMWQSFTWNAHNKETIYGSGWHWGDA